MVGIFLHLTQERMFDIIQKTERMFLFGDRQRKMEKEGIAIQEAKEYDKAV